VIEGKSKVVVEKRKICEVHRQRSSNDDTMVVTADPSVLRGKSAPLGKHYEGDRI
jgi:hypothetical protein